MKVFVHIGVNKTGSIVIQRFLGDNKEALSAIKVAECCYLVTNSENSYGSFFIPRFMSIRLLDLLCLDEML
jgi:hypothetical protein